ncbi:uncharacterized protein LACBIDRAFT_326415 [Laccaria bicolor S238N-H82]|uniref:Predicted protein n=1 Tax=Laccaria bicolor (strain S238N-H82 / ATCC MYA-4686) TaxID=486041 RepID=B0D8I0_LACBS|nr:uncharacterized protein LACBIDRAFT_326415 [Laccaria bicolor S238N-H82]EDR08840.1 predicted protein [Laccaria bicolor S238N-H82]|eukprot:XP_001880153.1 predicted protein [Laccaria bicolor S238N-H82]
MHSAYGALMCLVTCKVCHCERTQLAILKRFHELSTSIPPIQDDHANNIDTIQEDHLMQPKEMEQNNSETTNDLPVALALMTPVDQHQALAKDMDGSAINLYFGPKAVGKGTNITQPRRMTAEELQLFQDPENLHRKQFVLSGKDDSRMYEVIGYSRKQDRTVEYDVLFDDCGDSIMVISISGCISATEFILSGKTLKHREELTLVVRLTNYDLGPESFPDFEHNI